MTIAPRLRIGLVCPYALDVPGGVQNHVLGLAGWLRDQGHAVSVLAPGVPLPGLLERHGLDADEVTSAGRPIAVRYNGSVARITFGALTAGRVRRWRREAPVEVLHLHEPITPSASLLSLLGARVPVVATFHTATPGSRSMAVAGRVLRRRIDRIAVGLAVSPTAREVVRRHLHRDAQIVPNGFGHAQLSGATTVSRRPRRVAFLGRLDEPRKGLPVLLRAWPMIRAAEPDAELVVAGAGTRPERGAADGIVWAGMVSDAERARLLASAEVFVAPHLGRESFGLVVLEAMAAGAAVVASDIPAFRDVLTDDGVRHGHLFTAGDPRALADAVLARFYEGAEQLPPVVDPAAASRAARRYDWSVVGPRVEAAYRLALIGRPGMARRSAVRVDRQSHRVR